MARMAALSNPSSSREDSISVEPVKTAAIANHGDSCDLVTMQEVLPPGPGNVLKGCAKARPAEMRSPALSIGEGCEGIERLGAPFRGRPFHRIATTPTPSVWRFRRQTFHYRGEKRYCLPGLPYLPVTTVSNWWTHPSSNMMRQLSKSASLIEPSRFLCWDDITRRHFLAELLEREDAR